MVIARAHLMAPLLAAATLLSCAGALAQNTFAGGLALEAGHTFDLPRSWAVSVGPAVELRPLFSATDPELAAPPPIRNLDLNLAVSRRWLERWRFGTAVRLRGRYLLDDAEAARELRTWAYAERITDAGQTRWAHRFRTEQRFRGDLGDPLRLTYRHRYRVGFARALAGLSLDRDEWYVTGSVELLASTDRLAARPTAVDLRPFVSFGRNDVEVGLEYRTERGVDVETDGTERALLVAVIWSL